MDNTSWLDRVEYPFASHFFRVPAGNLHYVDEGSEELQHWECKFPDARVVRLATVGHYVQEEAPDALAAAVVPFLSETAAATR